MTHPRPVDEYNWSETTLCAFSCNNVAGLFHTGATILEHIHPPQSHHTLQEGGENSGCGHGQSGGRGRRCGGCGYRCGERCQLLLQILELKYREE